jgi:hypothetical protein
MTGRGSCHRRRDLVAQTLASWTNRFVVLVRKNEDRAWGCGIRSHPRCCDVPTHRLDWVDVGLGLRGVLGDLHHREIESPCWPTWRASRACTWSVLSSARVQHARQRLRLSRRTSHRNFRKLGPRLWAAPWTSVVPSPALSSCPIVCGLVKGTSVA